MRDEDHPLPEPASYYLRTYDTLGLELNTAATVSNNVQHS